MEIGSKIKQVRVNRGYSQEYMALQMGINAKTYGKLETSMSKITLDRLADISKILEIEPLDLIASDEKYSFNNYENNNCEIINQNNGCTKKESELYEKLLKEKETVIELLRSKLK